MIYRVTVTILGLLKKDENGTRRYVYIKRHILKHTPTFISSLVSIFLLILLINANLVSENRRVEINELNIHVTDLNNSIIQMEEDYRLVNSNFNRAIERLGDCQSTVDKKPPVTNTVRSNRRSLKHIAKMLKESDS